MKSINKSVISVAVFTLLCASVAVAAPAEHDKQGAYDQTGILRASEYDVVQDGVTEAINSKTDMNASDIATLRDHAVGADARITVLEQKTPPKDGKDGIDGKDGVTTTITKKEVDTATQQKVADNTKAISTATNQSASVAKDLQDAKQFFVRQQAESNAQFKNLRDEVDSNRKEARGGVASAVAIASMPQVEAGQNVMFSAGVGSFKNESALSVGASFHTGEHTIIKAGISDSTNNDLAMSAGIGIGF